MKRRGRFVGVVDGAFGRNGMRSLWIHLVSATYCLSFVLLCYNSLKCISMHMIFKVNFESRESDHIAVSGALNKPVLDTSHVSKVLTAALVEAFA